MFCIRGGVSIRRKGLVQINPKPTRIKSYCAATLNPSKPTALEYWYILMNMMNIVFFQVRVESPWSSFEVPIGVVRRGVCVCMRCGAGLPVQVHGAVAGRGWKVFTKFYEYPTGTLRELDATLWIAQNFDWNFTETLWVPCGNSTGTLRGRSGNCQGTLYRNFMGALRELYGNFTKILRGRCVKQSILRELYRTLQEQYRKLDGQAVRETL